MLFIGNCSKVSISNGSMVLLFLFLSLSLCHNTNATQFIRCVFLSTAADVNMCFAFYCLALTFLHIENVTWILSVSLGKLKKPKLNKMYGFTIQKRNPSEQRVSNWLLMLFCSVKIITRVHSGCVWFRLLFVAFASLKDFWPSFVDIDLNDFNVDNNVNIFCGCWRWFWSHHK